MISADRAEAFAAALKRVSVGWNGWREFPCRLSGRLNDARASASHCQGSDVSTQATSAFSFIHAERVCSPAEANVSRFPLPTRQSRIGSRSARRQPSEGLRLQRHRLPDLHPEGLSAAEERPLLHARLPAGGLLAGGAGLD